MPSHAVPNLPTCGQARGCLTGFFISLFFWEQRLAETQAMHRSNSSTGRVVLAPATRGPDACQMLPKAQLAQDAPPRTALGLLTENGQYRRTCGQVTPQEQLPWRAVVAPGFILPSYL